MPLFVKDRRRGNGANSPGQTNTVSKQDSISSQQKQQDSETLSQREHEEQRNSQSRKSKLAFHCQLAHGSPTGIICDFSNVRELYQKIADCYDMPISEVLFCTLNTHKVDMNRLLGGQIGLDDFIFAHRKGQAKEVEITKTEEALGLTITDNGAGYAFIKRIKDNSVIARAAHIKVGDHIERIDTRSVVGCRHFEVALMLKQLAVGCTFTLRLLEPLTAGFANIGPRGDARAGRRQTAASSYGSGKATLRLRAGAPAVLEQTPSDVTDTAINKINGLLENFLGINDSDLAGQIWELADKKANTMEFAEAIDGSELEAFGFSDDFIIELWGVVTDARAGRLAHPVSEMRR